jgi:SAM-dependent methyltransferase
MSSLGGNVAFGSKLTDEEYANFHLLRKSASSMDKYQLKKFDTIIENQAAIWNGRNITILSVGSGIGDFDIEIIQAIKDHGLKIKKYVCVEPIGKNIEPLKANLRKVLADDKFEVKESFFEICEFSESFDFIHSVHVIHWMSDPVLALKKMDSLLEEDGLSVSVLQSEKGMPRIYEALKPSTKGSLTAESLMAMTQSAGIEYNLDYVSAHLDVSSIIKQEELGKKILQFVISSRLNQVQYEESIPVIRHLAKEEDGKFLIEEPFAFISRQHLNK